MYSCRRGSSPSAFRKEEMLKVRFPSSTAVPGQTRRISSSFSTTRPPPSTSYLGGSNGSDFGRGIAVDSSGNAYVTGNTFSTNFPTANPIQAANGGVGFNDAFVTKLNALGSALLYSTYLGGNTNDVGRGIAVDSAGNAYVTGDTLSTSFPTTTDAFQPAGGTNSETFVAKIGDYSISGRVLDSGGNGIASVTVTLSGSNSDSATTDSNGNFILLNTTPGGNFTVTPFRAGFTFSPDSILVNNLDSNQSLIFIGTATGATPTPTPTPTTTPTPTPIPTPSPTPTPNFTISGQVTNGNGGAGIAAVTITLNGSQPATTQTDASGNYSFTVQGGGSYTVFPTKAGFTFNPPSQSFDNLSGNAFANFVGTALPTPTPTPTPSPTPTPAPARVRFEFSDHVAAEDCGQYSVAVLRTGDTTGALLVDYATSDDTARQKGDYTINLGTLRFAAGETRKNITLLITEDAYVEGDEFFTVNLFNLRGPATLEEPARASVVISDDDTAQTAANPIDNPEVFVCQQYHDFLAREPEPSGLLAWLSVLNNCQPGDQSCDRIAVSSGFFRSPEFSIKGSYAIRFYAVALGRNPAYLEFMRDLSGLNGQTPAETQAARDAFPADFSARPEFRSIYDALSNAQYVDRLTSTAGVALPNRDQLVADLNAGTKTRPQVLREVAESQQVAGRTFNRAFVLMQYFGYLRRDPEAAGYNAWLSYLTQNPSDFRTMVNGFVNSTEYRMRFGQP